MRRMLQIASLVACVLYSCDCRAAERNEFGAPAFSPDGKFIVFSLSKGESCFLYKAELGNGKAMRLTRTESGCEASPAYSPNGKLIAFS